MTRILIIEDEAGIAFALYKALNQAEYKVDTAKSGTSGLKKANSKNFDLVILDLGLPDMSGKTICRQLREDGYSGPIIILTAESSVTSKVALLDAGANDYLTKPFSIDELRARIRACLRQPFDELPEKTLLQTKELLLNGATRSVEREGQTIVLRRKEFAMLEYLMRHAGTAVTRTSLMNYAWEGGEESWTNTVDVHIKHLRDKIDRPFSRPLIKTVHGIGYKLDEAKAVAKIL